MSMSGPLSTASTSLNYILTTAHDETNNLLRPRGAKSWIRIALVQQVDVRLITIKGLWRNIDYSSVFGYIQYVYYIIFDLKERHRYYSTFTELSLTRARTKLPLQSTNRLEWMHHSCNAQLVTLNCVSSQETTPPGFLVLIDPADTNGELQGTLWYPLSPKAVCSIRNLYRNSHTGNVLWLFGQG